MNIQEKIDVLYTEALKAKQKDIVTIIRGLKSVLKNYIIEIGTDQLSDDQVLKLIKSEVKKRKDSIELYEKGGREDLAQKEREEIEFFMQFLPEQLSESVIEEKVVTILAGLTDEQKANRGIVMGTVMKEIGDAADGKMVAQVVGRLLAS